MLPNDYANTVQSRERWQGWLDLIEHPHGQGILPATTTARQRAALRGLARILISFGIENSYDHPEQDWVHLFNRMRRAAATEGLTGEEQLELVLDWARAEYKVRFYLLTGNLLTSVKLPGL